MDIIGLPGFIGAYSTHAVAAEFVLAEDVIVFPERRKVIEFASRNGVIRFPGRRDVITFEDD